MELRKDPITRSWVITGDDPAEAMPRLDGPCRFCESATAQQVITASPNTPGSPWSARSVVHPRPLYRIEGEPGRRGDGIYDCMTSVGAHEVLVENPSHDRHLWNASDEEIGHFLRLAAERILDLKRDARIKYVSLFKDFGKNAGQEFAHPTSQLTATMFVPRRVLYELRAGREYFTTKERCVFCDIIQQEERQAQRVIESRGDYLALGPYAPRVPYETWILPRNHESSFERTGLNKPGPARESGGSVAPHPATHSLHHRRLSPGAAHVSEQQPSLEESRLLEDHRRGLSLAHRDPSGYRFQGALLHFQRGLLLARELRERGEAAA